MGGAGSQGGCRQHSCQCASQHLSMPSGWTVGPTQEVPCWGGPENYRHMGAGVTPLASPGGAEMLNI